MPPLEALDELVVVLLLLVDVFNESSDSEVLLKIDNVVAFDVCISEFAFGLDDEEVDGVAKVGLVEVVVVVGIAGLVTVDVAVVALFLMLSVVLSSFPDVL